MSKLKVGDRVLCIKDDDTIGYHVGRIGYLHKPTADNGTWDFKFMYGECWYTHLNAHCFVLCTPMALSIYGD